MTFPLILSTPLTRARVWQDARRGPVQLRIDQAERIRRKSERGDQCEKPEL